MINFRTTQTEELDNNYNLCRQSILAFVPEAVESWNFTNQIKLPKKYSLSQKIVFGGMGGSSLPSRLVSSLVDIKVPFAHVEGYSLPSWVDKQTLVILCSYSGNTKETLSLLSESRKKGCLIFGITSGGLMQKILEKNKIPNYIFHPSFNISGQPRFGLAYMMFGILGILISQGLISNYSKSKFASEMKKVFQELSFALPNISKLAKEFSKASDFQYFHVISSGHLLSNARLMAAQVAESSKFLSFFSEVPEACHNLIEGYSSKNRNLATVFLTSDRFYPAIKDNCRNFQEILSTLNLKHYEFNFPSSSILGEGLTHLFFSSILSIELAKSNGRDPISIPLINKIKKSLS